MADVLFVVLVLALFGLARLLVTACDRIIGPEPVAAPERQPAGHEERAA
jgi:hypothetical protein